MCKFSSKSGGVPFQPLGDLTWNDPSTSMICAINMTKHYMCVDNDAMTKTADTINTYCTAKTFKMQFLSLVMR